MASKSIKAKKTLKNKNISLLVIIGFFAFVLIYGIQAVYAYYVDNASLSIIANLIGDFENNKGDANMIFYKQNDAGDYVRTYAIPAFGYVLNETATSCTIPCGNDPLSECYYSYNSSTQKISLTSNQKVMCKFYFDKEDDSDLKVYILKEDETGSYNYNSKTYSLVEAVPAYGYKHIHSYCTNGADITYNASNKTFNVSTTQKETCYAYFDSAGNTDLTVNVFVQSSNGSNAYKQVETIPSNYEYIISTSRESYCFDENGNTNTEINYVDGYINITATTKQTCNVYLDLVQ